MSDAPSLLLTLCFSGPLLYMGAVLLVYPDSFLTAIANTSRGIEVFRHRLQGISLPRGEHVPVTGTFAERSAVRLLALGVIAWAALPLIVL